ncbi:ATP-binding protein [Streptomyces sp. NRRL S-1813]|uniref:ATP-binding protein n=1 Tax=Streptomyces sp. NRRL S-1813 TaxID=1463888 RepID=UPI000AE0D218|nr:ATP-binding protein [Streptomyces sp. NRRL S-1813]
MNATAPSEFTGSHAMPYRDADFLCPLPHIPEAVGFVRRRAQTVLTGWNLPPATIEDAVLVISELVTNAVSHALPPAVLQLSRTGAEGPCALRIEVTDAGPAAGARRPADGEQPEEHGRGSGIVMALSVRHGIRAHRGRITRWADLPAA